MYNFKVTYNVKHINKSSSMFGVVSFDQTSKFGTLQEAMRFVRDMYNKKTSKIQVIGMPIVERI